jgi:hypothetical protein
MKTNRSGTLQIATLLLAGLACRPVFAIGWSELLILLVIIAVLLGPLMLRVYRTLEALRKNQDKPENKKKAN